ncbi:MAG: glycosyltransferase [Terriglobia bacterium]|jgi:glycosyltransferase involved in cell wall biosynthesis
MTSANGRLTASVVVPTRARPDFLRKCLESLVTQDYPKDCYEIIVVEDGTRDGEEIVRDISLRSTVAIRYQPIPHSGAATARNVGLTLSNNQIVAFIDDDGMASVSWLTRLLAALSKSGVAAVGGRVVPDYPDPSIEAAALNDGTLKFSGTNAEVEGLPEVDFVPGGNMAFWRQALLDIKGLDAGFSRGGSWREDTDVCVRLRFKGHRILYDSQAKISHRAARWQDPLDRVRPGIVWLMTRDDSYFRAKNYGWAGVLGGARGAARDAGRRWFFSGVYFLLGFVHLFAWIPGAVRGLTRKDRQLGTLDEKL